MKKRTKAGRGIRFSDVSNSSIRNILFEISKSFENKMSFEDIVEEAMEFFDYKCPYTGEDIKNDYLTKKELFDLDHIVPQNKECCGLNVRGNMVYVKKEVNKNKNKKDYKDFILNYTNGTLEEKNMRIERIHEYQKHCGYDADKITQKIKPILEKIYLQVADNQKAFVSEILKKINQF